MTPSAAHDQARNRSPKHDAMQVSVFNYLKRFDAVRRIEIQLPGPEKTIAVAECKWVIAEYDLKIKSNICAFVDIAQIFEYVEPDRRFPQGRTKRCYRLFEIKPSIDSVGGIIRQAKVIEDIALRALKIDYEAPRVQIIVVVPHDDPSLDDLLTMHGGSVLRWDMTIGCARGAAT